MYHCTDTQAVCRGCGKKLNGSPYFKGGSASVYEDGKYKHMAKKNYYGGWVCSRKCDINASSELECSMPGHGTQQYGFSSLDRNAKNRIISNWGE